MITQPKPEDIIKTSLGKRSSISPLLPAKEKTLENGVGRRMYNTFNSKNQRAHGAKLGPPGPWLPGFASCQTFTPASSTGWCKRQVQTLKAAESNRCIFSLSYATGETEAVNIWKHLSEAGFLISHFLKRKRKILLVLCTSNRIP